MAGTFTGKLMAEGQVPNAVAAIYTVPAVTTAFIKKMIFTNTSATPQTLIVYARRATNRVIAHVASLEQWETLEIENIVLEAADSIRAESTTNNVVDFIISGVEET
jgi:hypothetical protein